MKITICVPCHGSPKFDFVASLAALLIAAPKQIPGLDLAYATIEGSDLAKQRSTLAQIALDRQSDWLLWIDADQKFPADSLSRLLAHGKEVVGANYPKRTEPIVSSAAALDGSRLKPATGLEEVSYLGLGMCLVKADVLRRVGSPLFANGMEDVFFFTKLRSAGVKVWVDHDLSKRVGHIAERVLTFPQ